ncbi:hypothetical protein LTR56_021092 [Elasticomyces elasticus]|nr:hypothetical protein LTR56_021092 [Elasticomyces elasticus]KAK3631904.1 hypothetical protein LTR22_020837 [Elasticomyces elasticus]KAK4909729.1 hypothetical protein LTR49_021541 [Elasticomyces elasticus]KAK5749566.1 hypothetical protein LTS12_020353 [Elasticomyces elasticus]
MNPSCGLLIEEAPAASGLRVCIEANGVRTATTKDYNGDPIDIAWYPKGWHENPNDVPAFAFPVYVLETAPLTAKDDGFPAAFASFVERQTDVHLLEYAHYRFDIRPRPAEDIMYSMSHDAGLVRGQFESKAWPFAVHPWWDGYEGFFIAIDSDRWQTEGVTLVNYEFRCARLQNDVPHTLLQAIKYRDSDLLLSELQQRWEQRHSARRRWDLARRQDEEEALRARNNAAAALPQTSSVEESIARGEPTVSCECEDCLTKKQSKRSGSDDNQGIIDKRATEDIDADNDRDSTLVDSDLDLEIADQIIEHRLNVESFVDPGTIQRSYHKDTRGNRIQSNNLVDLPWSLDVLHVAGTVSHHTKESERRIQHNLVHRRPIWQKIVGRAAAGRLPVELIDLILDLTESPAIPNYLFRPEQGLEHLFLHLDEYSLDTPPMIYNWLGDLTPEFKQDMQSSAYDYTLKVTDLRTWPRFERWLYRAIHYMNGTGLSTWDPVAHLSSPMELAHEGTPVNSEPEE